MTHTVKTAILPSAARHNMYLDIHKGIRLGHARILAAIGAHDFSDGLPTQRLIADIRAFLALGKTHLASEDTHIHAALEARVPGSSAHAADDHEHHREAFDDLEAQLRTIEELAPDSRAAAGHSLYHRYALFMASDLEHMHGEETGLLAALHAAFNDDELRAIEDAIVSTLPPAKMMYALGLMIPAMNPPERLGTLRAMQAGMLPEVFAGVLADAVRPSLEPAAYAKIELALMVKTAA